MPFKNDAMWKQADLTTSKDTLQVFKKHESSSNPLVRWPSRSRSKVKNNHKYTSICTNKVYKNDVMWKQADLTTS